MQGTAAIRVGIALLHLVDRRLHVFVNAAPRNATQRGKRTAATLPFGPFIARAGVARSAEAKALGIAMGVPAY